MFWLHFFRTEHTSSFTFEPYLSRRCCHTVVPPSTVTLRRAAFHRLKRREGFSTSLLSTSRAKGVLEEEERMRRGDQEIDMMAAQDDATCHIIFPIAVVFHYRKLVASALREPRLSIHHLLVEIRLRRKFISGAQQVDMVATMEVGVCRKKYVSLSSSL